MVTQQDGEQNHTPQTRHGIVIAAVTACGDQSVEKGLIGDGAEEVADGGESGTIFQLPPSKQGLRGVQDHERTSGKGRFEYTK
jgi:hypothetical protein